MRNLRLSVMTSPAMLTVGTGFCSWPLTMTLAHSRWRRQSCRPLDSGGRMRASMRLATDSRSASFMRLMRDISTTSSGRVVTVGMVVRTVRVVSNPHVICSM